ncbi:hypothetical protein [Cohnella candidum]|nr:hypothetical protein [Cohnella candidum]
MKGLKKIRKIVQENKYEILQVILNILYLVILSIGSKVVGLGFPINIFIGSLVGIIIGFIFELMGNYRFQYSSRYKYYLIVVNSLFAGFAIYYKRHENIAGVLSLYCFLIVYTLWMDQILKRFYHKHCRDA